MQYRPLPLIILGILHILEPVGKILYYKIFLNDLSSKFLANLFNLPFLETFTWFALFPIAGVAILAVKSWSLPVFLLVETYVIISNMPLFKLMFKKGLYLQLSGFVLFTLLNILVVIFVLVPAVRVYYMDPKLRWWEAFPRYSVNLKALLEGFGETIIHDMSKSGIFVEAQDGIKEGDIIPVEFTANDQEFKLSGKVVAFFQKGDIKGMGIQFFGLELAEKRKLAKLIKAWDKEGIPRRPAKRNYIVETKTWFKRLFTTGKGLVPENNRK